MQVRAEFNLQTMNEEDRTQDVTWTTGYKGLRRTIFGDFYEELSLERSHVKMEFLQSGKAKFFDSHRTNTNDAVLGVVAKADVGNAKIRWSKDEISERNRQKVKDGILTDVSVGYRVHEYEDVSKAGDKIPTLRAVSWTPMEISLVPMGFDPGAVIRSEETPEFNEVIIRSQETIANEVAVTTSSEIQTQTVTRSESESMPLTEEQKKEIAEQAEKAKLEAVQAEQKRQKDIRSAVRTASLPETFADSLIERNLSVDEASKNILDTKKALEETQKTQINNTVRVEVGTEDRDHKRGGMEDALLSRIMPVEFKPSERAKDFIGKSMLRQFEAIIPRQTFETDSQYATRAMSSSDLPLIMANVAEKSVQKRYELAPRTFEAWTKKDTLRNYKEHSQVQAGDFSSLQKRKENGEFKYGSFGEKNEVVQLEDYGVIMKVTRIMFINDDLKQVIKVLNEAGVASRRLENKLCYSALRTNKAMKDTGLLYNNTVITTAGGHANLGTTGAIGDTTFTEANKLMSKQMTVDRKDYLNLTPKFLICGPDLAAAAKKFLSPSSPTANGDVNIWQGTVQPIVDAEIDNDEYYFAADPNQVDTVTLFHLEGQEAPRIESRTRFETEAFELKIAHTASAAPMDWRGLFKNKAS